MAHRQTRYALGVVAPEEEVLAVRLGPEDEGDTLELILGRGEEEDALKFVVKGVEPSISVALHRTINALEIGIFIGPPGVLVFVEPLHESLTGTKSSINIVIPLLHDGIRSGENMVNLYISSKNLCSECSIFKHVLESLSVGHRKLKMGNTLTQVLMSLRKVLQHHLEKFVYLIDVSLEDGHNLRIIGGQAVK
ncbi:hypothetical protein HG531_008678 [Fusarium graminearum]|nr:hypothetical protein HG531_008678 [Fusarium graminearum]